MSTSSASDTLYRNSFQRNIGVITEAEQEKLRRARVTLVGVGGVGGMALIQLARMGVGAVHAIDPDRFEASNLNRQMLSGNQVTGRPKAEVAARVATDINPSIRAETTIGYVTEANAGQLLAGSDVVIDGTDDLVARVIVHRAAASLATPSVWIAVTPPFRGAVMTMTPGSAPYEQALRQPSLGKPLTPDVRARLHALKDGRAAHSVAKGALPEWAHAFQRRETAWAVLSPVAGIIGLLAAFEAFKVILGRPGLEPVLAPALLRVDLGSPTPVEAVTPPEGSWDNTTL